jgi:hypothetical protein
MNTTPPIDQSLDPSNGIETTGTHNVYLEIDALSPADLNNHLARVFGGVSTANKMHILLRIIDYIEHSRKGFYLWPNDDEEYAHDKRNQRFRSYTRSSASRAADGNIPPWWPSNITYIHPRYLHGWQYTDILCHMFKWLVYDLPRTPQHFCMEFKPEPIRHLTSFVEDPSEKFNKRIKAGWPIRNVCIQSTTYGQRI